MNKKIISCAIAAFMVMGAMPIDVFSVTKDYTSAMNLTERVHKLKDGKYTINVKALKTDGSGDESMSKQYLEDPAHVYVENGKMKAQIEFNNSNFMSNHKVSVNKSDSKNFKKEELDGNIVKLTFDIDSLSDEIIVSTTIMGTMDVSLQVVLLTDTLKDKDGNLVDLNADTTESDESSKTESSKPSDNNNSENNKGDLENTDSTWKDGKYTIKNSILKSDLSGISHAKQFVEEYSDIEVKDGKKYAVLKFKAGTNMITDLSIHSKNGEVINYEEVKKDTDTYHVKFLVDSLDEDITVNIGIVVSNHKANNDFILRFDSSTLKSVNENINDKDEDTIGKKDDLGGDASDKKENSNGNANSDKQNTNVNIGIPLNENAKYLVQNDVLNASDNNFSLSGNYIDNESIVEVQNKKIYVTLKFKSKDILINHSLTVNRNLTRFTVVNNEGNNVYIKFQISSLVDKIVFTNKNNEIDEDSFKVVLNRASLKKSDEEDKSKIVTDTIVKNPIKENLKDDVDLDEEEEDEEDDDLKKGTYTIKNNALKEDSNSESMAREYLNKTSILDVKSGGKKYLTLKFTKGSLMSNVTIKVDGKRTSYIVVKDSGDNYQIKFKINSLSDEILVSSRIMNSMDVKFRVLLKSSTLKGNKDDDEEDVEEKEDVSAEEVIDTLKNSDAILNSNDAITNQTPNIPVDSYVPNSNFVSTGGTNAASNNESAAYKRETYSVRNEIVTSSKIGYQAARNVVSNVSYLEVENGVNYMTVGFGQTNVMKNIRISIDGQNVSYDVVNEDRNNNTMSIRFKIPSVSTQVTVTANIAAMGRDTSFGLKFLESTLTHINSEESSLPIASGSTSSLVSNLMAETNVPKSSSSDTSGELSNLSSTSPIEKSSENNADEVLKNGALEAKEYFKKYSIKNEVVSDSTIGKMMARKYLSENSILEDIDGKLYLTLTYSGTDSMDNFRFSVNGEDVDYAVVSDEPNSGSKSFRFIISSVNDEIQSYIYIKPMNMDINFGVKLDESSMVLLDEGAVSDDGNIKGTGNTLDDFSYDNLNDKKNQDGTVKTAVAASGLTLIINYLINGAVGFIRKRRILSKDKVI